MKAAFKNTLTRVAELKRGDEVISFVLHPLPLGFHAHVARVYPAPVEFIGTGTGPAQARPVESASYEHGYRTSLILIAKGLREQIEAVAPTTDDRASWDAYALKVQAEMGMAGLVEGDIMLLKRELDKVNAGLARLGNAAAPS